MLPRPLKPQHFHILLALSHGELHGYGIQRAVLEQTDNQIRLWPAMLYRSIGKLEDAKLIGAAEAPPSQPDDERRIYYAITKPGRLRLRQEADMMARWASQARSAES
jgi:DNA-binding PadR family transcriptional regulator